MTENRDWAGKEIARKSRNEALPPHKVPGLGRFYGNADSPATESAKFYATTRRLNAPETEIKGLRADGKTLDVGDLMRAVGERMAMAMRRFNERVAQVQQ